MTVRQEVIEAHRLETGGDRHHALMALRAGLAVQSRHGHDLHRYALALRLELDGVKNLRGVLRVGHEDLLHFAPAGLQELENGVSTLDLLSTEALLFASVRRTSRPADLTAGQGTPALSR